MFSTTTDVKNITGKIVNNQLVERAQYIIEAYVGKFEDEVEDTNDLEVLKRAVAYQCAYMSNNEDLVYEQMSVSTTGQNDAYTTFKSGDKMSPFIAPLAIIICRRLSFLRPRSIKTGKILPEEIIVDWSTI
jgi:hypothetical protein